MECKNLKDNLIENINITLNAKIKQIPLALNLLENFVSGHSLTNYNLYSIKLCLEELLLNIIEHGYNNDEKQSFNIYFEKYYNYLKITINEKGAPYDIDTLYLCSKNRFGLNLIRNFVDKVYLNNQGTNGREIILIKHFNTPNSLLCKYNYMKNESSIQQPIKKNINYIVRKIKSDEYIEICKCAYSSYGYSYSYEDIYYPHKMKKLNNSKKLISYVAATNKNEIISHAALKIDNKDGELLAAFTKPQYRGLNCLNSIVSKLLLEGHDCNLNGVYVHAVCAHIYSQKSAHRYNFKDCALFLCKVNSLNFKNIQNNSYCRDTLLFCYKYLNKNIKLKLYIPKHHEYIIKKIYSQFNICIECIYSCNYITIDNKCIYDINIDSNNAAIINILSCGKNIADLLYKEVKNLCYKKIEVIYLYMNLEDPNICMTTQELEKIGFFFCGVKPGPKGDNKLILQYLNNILVDYSNLKMNSKLGNILLNYIMNCDPNLNIFRKSFNTGGYVNV